MLRSSADARRKPTSRCYWPGAIVMEDDDDFREFLKVDKQYFDATKEERDRLQPDFERAINKVVPGLLEKADTRLFNGDYLKDMVNQCVNRGLARADLTSYGRINLIEDGRLQCVF
jgi:hypothetical protein